MLKIAYHYRVDISDKRLKDTVKSILKANLYEVEVLPGKRGGDTGDSVLVLGMGLVVLPAPLHRLHLFSELVQGEVSIGVCQAFAVKGVHLILGNWLAGGRVWPDVPPLPVVDLVFAASDGVSGMCSDACWSSCWWWS